MTDPSRLDARIRGRQRRTLLGGAVTIAVVAVLMGYMLRSWTTKVDDSQRRADQAVTTAVQLCEQVRQLGGACVVDPGELRGDTGPAGDVGPRGPAGADGADGVDGLSGAVGPTGPAGIQGDQGPAGEAGATGPQGEPGATGPAGAPAASWTFMFLGVKYTCTRDVGSPDEAPTYTCTPAERGR